MFYRFIIKNSCLNVTNIKNISFNLMQDLLFSKASLRPNLRLTEFHLRSDLKNMAVSKIQCTVRLYVVGNARNTLNK